MKINAVYAAIIVLFSVLSFFNSFGNGFAFDDHSIVDQNYAIRSAKNVPKLLFSSYWSISQGGAKKGLYRPLVMLSYVADYAVWKLNAFGYHLVNLLFHCLNSLFLFFFFGFVLGKCQGRGGATDPYMAVFPGALFFAVHPVHVEAVTGIVGRAELFSSFFYLAALYAYVLYRENDAPQKTAAGRSRLLLLSLGCYLLSLFSKETGVTMPAMAVACDFFFFRKPGRKTAQLLKENLAKYLAYAGAFIFYLVVRLAVLGTASPQGSSRVFDGKVFLRGCGRCSSYLQIT